MRIRTRTGTEGPAWDPYGWEETEVEHRGRTVVLRTGLGCWVEVDGVRITDREEEVFQKFEEVVGYPVDKIQRWHQKAS